MINTTYIDHLKQSLSFIKLKFQNHNINGTNFIEKNLLYY